MFLTALACGVRCNENLPSQLPLHPKNKRGINDHSVTFPSESSSSYSSPVHSSLSSGYELGGSSGGFSLGHPGLHSSGGSVGHGIAYSLAPSSSLSLGSGYQSPGLNHGSLGYQSASLGGHSAQSSYSVPSVANLGSGGSSNALFTPSKIGPVTFGLHGGGAAGISGTNSYSTPVYATGGNGLSAYSNGGTSSVGLQISLLGSSQHGLSLGSSGTSSSYSLPVHSQSSSPSHSVTGGLIIASGGSHGSSPSYSSPSYSSPSYSSSSSHGISGLSSSSGIHGSSATYALPISSGSHGISALSSGAGHPASSGSYSSSGTHSGFSGISSGGSSYELPIASGSHSNSGSSNVISHYVPSHSSGGSSGISYAAPSISHIGSPGSSYPGGGGGFSSNYVGSGSSPIVAHAGSHGYTPMYYSSSGSHGIPADSHAAYSNINPRYLGYTLGAKIHNVDLGSAKYDTISYSVPNGK